MVANSVIAQQKSWEVATDVEASNTHYRELSMSDAHEPMTLEGNSMTPAALHAYIAYHADRHFHVPLFLTLQSQVPIFASNGDEAGHLERNGTQFLTQKELVRHSSNFILSECGYELLPILKPYLSIEFNEFLSRRTNQVEGTDDGELLPAKKQDYLETVTSSHLGVGIQGGIPLTESAGWRIRYDVGYQIPQAVKVTNTFFDQGYWGQGTTGYTLKGRLQLDLPFALTPGQARHDGYVTIGSIFQRRHWNGDGRTATEIFANPHWPENTIFTAGAFLGTGVFF
jgi:hypothetical protein